MIENNLLKTNFLGKDGFRWWIGQVAPEAAQGDQLNQIGNTWGCRLKVRIYGYHPADITELPDKSLPWAQVLLSSQGGSGKANRSRSVRISPGDTVMGFFLDGDDAQLPVILGIFANTGSYYASDEEYKSPFEPFTGYTSKIKPNNDFIAKNEGGDDSNKSQKSPRFLTKEIVEDLNDQLDKGKAQIEQLVDSGQLQNAASEASAELNQVLASGSVQTGLKNTAANAKPIVENLKKQFDIIFPYEDYKFVVTDRHKMQDETPEECWRKAVERSPPQKSAGDLCPQGNSDVAGALFASQSRRSLRGLSRRSEPDRARSRCRVLCRGKRWRAGANLL